MNNKALLSVFVLTLICCASCKKEKETEMVTLKLALEQPTDPSNQKVYLDGQKLVCWYGGGYSYQYGLSVVNVDETIKINNSGNNNNNTYNVENNTIEVPSGSTFTAVYPATTTAGDFNTADAGTVTYFIPAVQTFTPGPNNIGQNLRDLPMAAYLDPSESGVPPVLMFRNLASLIKVTVHNPSTSKPYRLNSIKLSSTNGQPLHGKFTYTFSHSTNNTAPGTPTPSGTQPAYNSEVMLDFNHAWETVSPNGSRDFYIVVAPFSNSSLRIQIRGALLGTNSADHYSNGSAIQVRTKEYAASKSLVRNKIGIFDIKPDQLNGFTISGGFTVASGQVSYFSPGNLSLGHSSKFENTWCFHTGVLGEQYDCWGAVHNATAWGLDDKSGNYLDLFPYTDVQATYDVGTYFPINDEYTDEGLYRCPTYSEWENIITSRAASTVNGTANAHYAKAVVNNRNGLILFPDTYIQPSGFTINSINTRNAGYSVNSISLAKWKLMEAAGAVFLPASERIINLNAIQGNYGYWADPNSLGMGYYWGVDWSSGWSRFDFSSSNLQNYSAVGIAVILTNMDESYLPGENIFSGHNWSYIQSIYYAIRPIRN